MINADSGNLTLNTNTLAFNDLIDHDYSRSSSYSVETSINFSGPEEKEEEQKALPIKNTDPEENAQHPGGSTHITVQDKGHEIEGITRATIGEGTINVTDLQNSDDLETLNRDLEKFQEITRDEITGGLNVNLTLDHAVIIDALRGFPELRAAVANIAENFSNLADALLEDSEELSPESIEHFESAKESLEEYKKLKEEGSDEAEAKLKQGLDALMKGMQVVVDPEFNEETSPQGEDGIGKRINKKVGGIVLDLGYKYANELLTLAKENPTEFEASVVAFGAFGEVQLQLARSTVYGIGRLTSEEKADENLAEFDQRLKRMGEGGDLAFQEALSWAKAKIDSSNLSSEEKAAYGTYVALTLGVAKVTLKVKGLHKRNDLTDPNELIDVGRENAAELKGALQKYDEAYTDLLIKRGDLLSVYLKNGKGFKSFDAFKREYGKAGDGDAWHHIVEQHADNVSKFGAENIHNTKNLIALPDGAGDIHRKLTGHYNSKMLGTNKTVREYVKSLSYDEQYKYGIQKLKDFGYKGPLP